jgi:thioredoxin reductase (NADPH)
MCGHVDRPIAALLKDLKQRGMLKDTLVVWCSEFGRTPNSQGGKGRDHNPLGYTMWLAGGGAKPGTVVGATDEFGLNAIEGVVSVSPDTGAPLPRWRVIPDDEALRRLDVPRLDEFEMGGVYYAATQAEAQLCAGDPVLIVGGGNSAGQAAMFLSRRASQCRLLIRGGDLAKSMSRYLVDQIERNDLVQVCHYSEVVELGGERDLETVTVADNRSGERSEVPAEALFVFIGASPHTEWLDGQLATDDDGFLLTGRDVQDGALAEHNGNAPFVLETSRPGIFAVGDVRSGSIKRVASAVGEGSMAVRLVHDRLAAS